MEGSRADVAIQAFAIFCAVTKATFCAVVVSESAVYDEAVVLKKYWSNNVQCRK